jgi:hypothetical protein
VCVWFGRESSLAVDLAVGHSFSTDGTILIDFHFRIIATNINEVEVWQKSKG